MKLWRLVMVLGIMSVVTARAQVIVNGKNLNEDLNIEYIQFSFYFETKKLSPVYFIDYGLLVSENDEIPKPTIQIGEDLVTDRMTPVYVLNRLYKEGWEYLGDAIFMPAPLLENTQTFTLRRRVNDLPTTAKSGNTP